MKYIILCGSNHNTINGTPRQLVTINGEVMLERTIRLLRENGVDDIAITATDKRFKEYGVPVIEYDSSGAWINCFYLTDDPVCYIFGDVYFSEQAIDIIVKTLTSKIEFFASSPPFSKYYPRQWAEPFAFKVVDTAYFRQCVETVKQYARDRLWRRDAISWETWQVIKNTPINRIDYGNYVAINDYTCDIDYESDIPTLEKMVRLAHSQE